nr:YciI family protein [Mesorhizobium sp.]
MGVAKPLWRVRAGKASWTDGPFAETKEHLGGFLLIERRTLRRRWRSRSGTRSLRLGAIEVRETAGFLASKCPGYFHQPQTSASVTPIGGRNGRFGSCALVGPECPVSESKIGPGRSGQGQVTTMPTPT